MVDILMPTLVLAATGGGLGLILAIVDKIMYVPGNQTVEEILAVLPGVNCGACGYIGCGEYAEALGTSVEPNVSKCTPGGNQTAQAIGKLLGIEASEVEGAFATVKCAGTCDKTSVEYIFEGIPTCAVCATYYDGKGQCDYGCIGFGDCTKVCAYDALYVSNGIAIVDRELCTGCGMCVGACPMKIIDIEPAINRVKVECSSPNKGAVVRKLCSAGCIACKLCEKACEFDAIKVENNLAKIDPLKCTNCEKCVSVCPTKVIKSYAI